MKAILVMYDTLNRHMLTPYGADWTHTPAFERLAQRAMVFDKHFVGSLPCIPARRELHTGRYNFLHRSWGPLEPFDDSMPQILKENHVYTHIVTDHLHYFEEGGATYHQRYNSWELSRGQEGDPYKADVKTLGNVGDVSRYLVQDTFNRTYITKEEDFPQTKTFTKGLQFIDHNHEQDNWFLTIETFDPHEPYHVPEHYKALYADQYDGEWPDWPMLKQGVATANETKYAHAALTSMCDANLQRLMDKMDAYNMWEDTMLIVITDHGFLLGEHGALGKNSHPYYTQVCNIPCFMWDPRTKNVGRCQTMTQTIDIAPTLLSYFNIPIPKNMLGVPLDVSVQGNSERLGGLFGVHSHFVSVTDGQYIYTRALRHADTPSAYNYTLMPTHMHDFFSVQELQTLTCHPPFSFTKNVPVMKIKANSWSMPNTLQHDLLFDIDAHPDQNTPLCLPEHQERLKSLMLSLLKQNDAPPEMYERLALCEDQ